MHWSAPLQQWLLKLFVKPSTIGEQVLATGPHTYFVLEQKRSSLPLVLRTRARNQACSALRRRPRAPVGRCSGWLRSVRRAGKCLAGIKCGAWVLRRHPTGSHPPCIAGHPARNQARSAPGERLPVRAGWRFGEVGAEGSARSDVARIKRPAQVMYAPTHGQSRALCCWVP